MAKKYNYDIKVKLWDTDASQARQNLCLDLLGQDLCLDRNFLFEAKRPCQTRASKHTHTRTRTRTHTHTHTHRHRHTDTHRHTHTHTHTHTQTQTHTRTGTHTRTHTHTHG